MDFTIRADGADEAARKLAEMRRSLPAAALAAVRGAVGYFIAYTVKSRFDMKGPRYLNRKTGTAIRSVTTSWKIEASQRDDTRVAAAWGSNLDYVMKHEFGGTYREHVRAYVRRLKPRTSKKTRAAAREAIGMQSNLAAKRAQASALGVAYVREHSRTRTYRERRMFRDALDDRDYILGSALRFAVDTLQSEGRAPTTREVLSFLCRDVQPPAGFVGE